MADTMITPLAVSSLIFSMKGISKKSLLPFDKLTMSIPFYSTKLKASKNQLVYDTLSDVNSLSTYISASGAIPGHSLLSEPATPVMKVPCPRTSLEFRSWLKFTIYLTFKKSESEESESLENTSERPLSKIAIFIFWPRMPWLWYFSRSNISESFWPVLFKFRPALLSIFSWTPP